MPRRGKQDYLDDAYEDDDDAYDGYETKQHPTSKYAKGLRTGAKQKEEENEDAIESIDVDPNFHRFLIGRQGCVRLEIETKNNVVVDIPRKDSHDRKIYVNGRRTDCKKAIDDIKDIVAKEKAKTSVSSETSAFPSLPGQEIVTVSVDFEKSAIGSFIGQGGSRLRDLKQRLMSRGENIPTANREVGVEVILPDRNDTGSIITIKIPKHTEEKAAKIINEFCSFFELESSLKGITVANQSVGSVLKGDDGAGRGGEKATKTRNNNHNKKQQQQTAEASSSSASASGSGNKNTKAQTTNNTSNNTESSSNTIGVVTATRPDRTFPEFVVLDDDQKKYNKHQVLECRF